MLSTHPAQGFARCVCLRESCGIRKAEQFFDLAYTVEFWLKRCRNRPAQGGRDMARKGVGDVLQHVAEHQQPGVPAIEFSQPSGAVRLRLGHLLTHQQYGEDYQSAHDGSNRASLLKNPHPVHEASETNDDWSYNG